MAGETDAVTTANGSNGTKEIFERTINRNSCVVGCVRARCFVVVQESEEINWLQWSGWLLRWSE